MPDPCTGYNVSCHERAARSVLVPVPSVNPGGRTEAFTNERPCIERRSFNASHCLSLCVHLPSLISTASNALHCLQYLPRFHLPFSVAHLAGRAVDNVRNRLLRSTRALAAHVRVVVVACG